MTKDLEQYRLPARLRRRPPFGGDDGAIRLSVTPKAFLQEMSMDNETVEQWKMPASTVVYPLRAAAERRTPSELITAAQMMRLLREDGGVRPVQLATVRHSLATESYENALKMERAVEALLSDLADLPDAAD